MHSSTRFRIRSATLSLPLLLVLSSCGMLNSCSLFRSLGIHQTEQVRVAIGKQLSSQTKGDEVGKLAQSKRVREYYRARNDAPVWTGGAAGESQVGDFIKSLEGAARHGLDPELYHLGAIRKLRDGNDSTGTLAALDVLLTDAYFAYASDLSIGHVNPGAVDDQWLLRRRMPDLAKRLSEAVTHGNVAESLEKLAPSSKEYVVLQKALEQYRQIAGHGGWPQVPFGPVLAKGMRGPRVEALRKRLAVTGELSGAEGDAFDDSLKAAVQRFQSEHDLAPNGIVNDDTVTELNVPVSERINQIAVNLERWRWLPRMETQRHIEVDVAKYEVRAYDGKEPVITMKAIIGKDENQTPILIDEMTQIVLNPAWNIPPSIAGDELLPKIRRNPAYLKQHNIAVYKLGGKNKEEIDANSVDWSKVDPEHFPYLLTQAPGKRNPLGSIKFVFPNPLAIYLHGTANPHLFQLKNRAFSHGCIRIEKPIQLALFVLNQGGGKRYDRDDLMEMIHDGDQKTIRLPEPMPVEVLYWTAAVGDEGRLRFRKDVYGWDRPVLYALHHRGAPTRVAE